MDPQEAAQTADRLVTVLEQPQPTDSSRLESLGEAIAALAARMDPREAARTAASHRLVTVLEQPQPTDSFRLCPRQGSSSLAARMDPQEAARLPTQRPCW